MQDSLKQALPQPMLEALHAGHNQYMPVVLDDFTTFLQYKLAEIFMKNPAKDDCIRRCAVMPTSRRNLQAALSVCMHLLTLFHNWF